VEPWEDVKVPLSFYLAIRPYNPESVVPIFSIHPLPEENGFLVNGKDRIYIDLLPDRIVCSNQEKGDSFFLIEKPQWGSITGSEDKGGLCNAFAEFKAEIDAVNSFSLKVIVPLDSESVPPEMLKRKYTSYRSQNLGLWNRIKEGTLKISTPDSRVNEAFEASKNNLLILVDSGEVTPGPFTYHKMWFRDAAYAISAMLKLGLTGDAKRILENYFAKQRADGYFESQNGEWDSNGEALWTICQYFFFTRDEAFVQKHFRDLERAVEWIFKNRKKACADSESLHYGLLPAGYSAEHFGPSNHYYWDNFWAYAGVRDLIKVGKELGKKTSDWEKENAAYLEDIERSIRRVQDILGEKYIPSSPYRRKDSSLIGTVAAAYPLQIIDEKREDFRNTLRLIRKRYMESGAFFHKLLHSGYNVYLTAQVAECYLLEKSTLAIPILNWILDHATKTWTFPEAIHPETGGGCMGDGHHGWATSELCHLIRNMLFLEKEETLILFPVIPQHWLDEGNIISVKEAKSHFGTFDFSLTSLPNHAILHFKGTLNRKELNVELNMPVKMDRIILEGKDIPVHDRKALLTIRNEVELKILF
jgi:hypothetical protein